MQLTSTDLTGGTDEWGNALETLITSGVRAYDQNIVQSNASPIIIGLIVLALLMKA